LPAPALAPALEPATPPRLANWLPRPGSRTGCPAPARERAAPPRLANGLPRPGSPSRTGRAQLERHVAGQRARGRGPRALPGRSVAGPGQCHVAGQRARGSCSPKSSNSWKIPASNFGAALVASPKALRHDTSALRSWHHRSPGAMALRSRTPSPAVADSPAEGASERSAGLQPGWMVSVPSSTIAVAWRNSPGMSSREATPLSVKALLVTVRVLAGPWSSKTREPVPTTTGAIRKR